MSEDKLFQSHGLRKAQGLVEFALILPILLLSLFVVIEIARVFHAWIGLRMGHEWACDRL